MAPEHRRRGTAVELLSRIRLRSSHGSPLHLSSGNGETNQAARQLVAGNPRGETPLTVDPLAEGAPLWVQLLHRADWKDIVLIVTADGDVEFEARRGDD